MRGSRSSRRAAAQRPVSYAEPSFDDDFQVGKESGTDEAEVEESDGNGRSPNQSGKPQKSSGRTKRAADLSLQTRSKRGVRGSGGSRGRGDGIARGCVGKKPGPSGPYLDAKAAVAAGDSDNNKTKAGLGGTAVDGKAAATEEGDGKGDVKERKPRSERLRRVCRNEATDGKDSKREEAGERDNGEDSDEEGEADWRPSPEKKMEDEEDGPRRRSKRSASEKPRRRTSTSSDVQRDNPFLKQFGFKAGSTENSQENVDWNFSGPRIGSKSSSAGKNTKAPTSSDGTSPKESRSRRSGRTQGKRPSYAEPSSGSAHTEDSDSSEAEIESEDDDEESSEDDIFEDDKKESNGKSAKKSSGPGGRGGSKGRGQKRSKVRSVKVAEAQTGGRRKRPREKPVALRPKVEGTRRSAREKPPVCYSERVVDMDVDKRRDAGAKAEEHGSSDRQSMDSDVLRGKKSSNAGKAKRQAAATAAATESKQKGAKRHKRSKPPSSSDDKNASDMDEGSEDEYDQEDGSEDDGDCEVKSEAASRPSRGGGRNKGKGRATSVASLSSSESEEEDEDDEEEEEKEPLRADKIVARKKLLPSEWRELCKDMNTAEVKAGSMWGNGPRNGGNGKKEDGEKPVEKFLVKWSGMSYLHVSWETYEDLIENGGKMINMKVRKFREREFDVETELERGDGEYFDPSLTVLDRVLDVDEMEGEETRLLVKWLGAPYSECTYELVGDLEKAGQDYAPAVEAYRCREDMSKLLKLKPTRKRSDGAPDLDKDPPVFKNGGSLRDYQREGVRWMVFNWLHKRGSILADEMGLGKTLQTVTFLRILHLEYGIPGPFLVVAPLSTVTHWQREFQTWSDMNTVVFHGYQDDRDILEEYELEYSKDKERKMKDKTLLRGRRIWKSTVVVTTPELCIKPDVSALLGRKIHWDVLVVDEAHRLKNTDSKLNVTLKDHFTYDSALLLTGTPLQNSTEELWTLLNLVDRSNFKDKDGFVEMYGDLQEAKDVDHLQQSIKPYLLRRMKEDVEKAVPPKEETIIEVELTEVQKQYYRAIYEQNTTFLLQGKKRPQDGPSLMNLAMQLRKCCNHPYLIDGVEDAVRAQMGDDADSKDHLVRHSGKLVLLDKLLPRLKEQGHRVLIFSQFKLMLNILEDYLIASDIPYGRIDGSIQGNVRQKAIDSFQAPNSDMLVMLLSTRAGGVGITLTAADTCIIYDSDWNPQNDVQAQARCHRIGQTKSVKVYRLLVAKTYEMHMFKTASKKLGLDQAVLAGSRPKKAQDKVVPTAKEVEKLLKHGAYDVFQEGEEGVEAGKKFCEDSIDAILSRATVVNHSAEGVQDGKPSNSFSKASFVSSSNDASGAVDMNDPEFWTKCVGLTVPVEEEEKLGRRKARSGKKEYKIVSDSDGGSGGEDLDRDESEFEDVPSEDTESTLSDRHLWSEEEISSVAGALFLFGYGQWEKIRDRGVGQRSLGDVAAVGRAIVAIMLQTEAIANAKLSMKKAREHKVCNKLFAMVIARERRERMKKEEAKKAAAAAAAAATAVTTPVTSTATAATSAPTATAATTPATSTATSAPTATAATIPATSTASATAATSAPTATAATAATTPGTSTATATSAPTATTCGSASTAAEGTEKPSSDVEKPLSTAAEKPLATAVEKPPAADVAGGGQAAAPTPAASNSAPGRNSVSGRSTASGGIIEGVGGGEAGVPTAPASMTLPIIGSLAERATDEEKKLASISVPQPPESEVQANVRTALLLLLNKHHASRRALGDMRRVVGQSEEAKRKAQAVKAEAVAKEKADADVLAQVKKEAFRKVRDDAVAQAKAEVAAQEKAEAMVKMESKAAAKKDSEAAANEKAEEATNEKPEPPAKGKVECSPQTKADIASQEEGKAESKDTEEEKDIKGKQEAGTEAGVGASDGDKADGAATVEVTKGGEKRDGKGKGDDAVDIGDKGGAMASRAAMPGDGSSGGSVGSGGAPASSLHAAKPGDVSSGGSGGSGGAPPATPDSAQAVKEKVDDDLAIITKLWKPKLMGADSKFRSQSLVRISAKLSLLDEIEDLRRMMESTNPPFGMMTQSAPEGWRSDHDRWLVRSVCDLGWFTSMQKKRAAVIQDDPSNTWPGLISMPDHVFLGRRLKALVAKFRDERRQTLREAEKAKEVKRKIKEENEARRKRDWDARQSQLVEERASLAVTAVAKTSMASKERPIAPQTHDVTERANNVAEAQLQRLLAEQRGRAAVATAAAAVAAVRTGTGASGGNGDKLLPHSHSQQQQQGQGQGRVFKSVRVPSVAYTFPPNVDPSAANMRTVYDESGKLKGYRGWPSEEEARATIAPAATTAMTAVSPPRPEDRIRGLAGIVVPGVNGNPATANTSVGGKPFLAGAEPPQPPQQQNQHNQQREFEGPFGAKPESGAVNGGPWSKSNQGVPVMGPAASWNSREGGVGTDAGEASASGPHSSLRVPLPVVTNNSSPVALSTVNGFRGAPPVTEAGRGGAEAVDLLKASVSTCEAAASTEDGILLRHAIHNLGVPISMLENYDSSNAVLVSAAASECPLRRALDMSWLKLANGNDSLSPSMAESIGVHLLSKAAAVAKDTFGLRLPRYDYLGPIPEKERVLLTAFLQSAAKATQLRASLLRYTQLREIQSFAARLARAKELRNPTMPVWWRPELHDAHLLVASCIYGSSSDYGVQRAMRETTAVTIKTHGSTVSEEKENSKIESPYAIPGCATAEQMAPLCSMSPPLTASLAKTRVKHLHSAAFVQAKRLYSSAAVGNCAGSGASSISISNDSCVTQGNGVVVDDAAPTPVASASPSPVIVINDNARVSPSGEAKVSLTGSEGDSAEDKGKMKRPVPQGEVEVLDLCGDDDEVDVGERTVSELPLKKLKATPAAPDNVGETAKEAVVAAGVDAGEAAPSTSAAVPAPSVSSTGSDSGSKGGTGESPEGQKKGTAEAAVVVDEEVTDKTSSKELSKTSGTLDSFWNSP